MKELLVVLFMFTLVVFDAYLDNHSRSNVQKKSPLYILVNFDLKSSFNKSRFASFISRKSKRVSARPGSNTKGFIHAPKKRVKAFQNTQSSCFENCHSLPSTFKV